MATKRIASGECRAALLEPGHHAGAGAALRPAEQALIAGQVDEAGVVGIDACPGPGEQVRDPACPPAAGLIDAQHRGRLRLGQLLGRGLGDAACAVGQDTPNASATSATLRAASPTARPIALRNRPVLRRPAGISWMASVNDPDRTPAHRSANGPCANAPGSDPARRADPSAR